ncbi:MAG: Chromate resistance protein ChrB [Chloroflexota bacterium]
MNWLLFLPQLPASPSTLRVTVWRRMRAAGAFGLQNGVWVLPSVPENKQFIENQMIYIREQGAGSYVFDVVSINPSVEESILAGFRVQRDEEYTEFCERCDALLAELEKETAGEKFTFAELEEAETDVHKLETWLGKITARDFVGGNQRQSALDKLERCREAYQEFAVKVYAQQGIDPTGSAEE